MAQPVGGDGFSKTVVLLKKEDCERRNGKVYMPNTIEMAQIKKPVRGQYKANVQFSKIMGKDMVRQRLHEEFPTFDLMNVRFSCTAVSQDSITFQFHGTPCVWDGRTIKRKIKGNSVLYIVMEYDQMDVSSGISASDSYSLQGNNNIPQTNEQTNPVDLHVHLDDEEMLFAEPTALNNTGETPLFVAETEMEVDDRQKGNNDELAVNDIFTLSVNQVCDTPEDDFSSATTSGMVSGSDLEISEENLSSPPLAFERDVNFKVLANPDESPLKGGGPCCCTIDAKLLDGVTSGHACLGPLGTVDLQRLPDGSLLFYFPAAIVTGSYPLLLESQDGKYLGDTTVTYYDDRVRKMVHAIALNPCLQSKFFNMCMHSSLDGNNEHTGDESQSSGSLEFTGPVKMLSLAVYAAAESGAQQFIEMIFTSSAGRAVFNVYKKNPVLPEVIAKDHGNKETAKYLEGITIRFSEEIRAGKECSQTIDWSELVTAAEAAEKQLDLASEKEDDQSQKDIPKETGYLGDIDTSSSESSEAQSSDSDDDISRPSMKEIQTKAEECIQPVWEHGDHAIEAHMASITESLILFLKDGTFPRGKAYVKAFYETKPLNCKENGLHLIQASRFQEAYNVRKVKYLQYSGISFLLGLGCQPVQHHLITVYQRLGYLLKLSTERNAYYEMHVDTAEDHQSLEHLSITVGNVADYKASRLDVLQQLCCRLINGEFTATENREDFTVRRKSAECLMEQCQSTAPDFWVLTCIFRPTRKTLFVYVADSKDVFPLASCFDDRQYELSWECQHLQGCKNNVPKVQEINRFPESKSGKKGETWQQGDLHRKDPNRDTGNPIASNYLDRKETLHQFESRSGKTGEIWQQGDLHRRENNRDTGDPNPVKFLDRKETLYQFQAKSGKKGEIWQQGYLHRRDRNRDSSSVMWLSCVAIIGAGFGCGIGWYMLTDRWRIFLLCGCVTAITLLAIIELLDRMKNNTMERRTLTEDYESSNRNAWYGELDMILRPSGPSESKSGKKDETWELLDLHRKDPNRLTGNPIGGNYLDHKETSHQFEFRSSKKGEIWQQGHLRRRQHNRGTGDPNPVQYLDRKESLHQFGTHIHTPNYL